MNAGLGRIIIIATALGLMIEFRRCEFDAEVGGKC